LDNNTINNKQIIFPPGPAEIIPYRLALKFISNPLPVLIEIVNNYGDISHFKFGPKLHVYLINNAFHIENILVKHNNNFIKSPGLRLAKRVLGNGLITNEGQMHEHQRRLIQPAFNRNRIKTYGKIISEHSFEYTDGNWKDEMILDIHKEMTKLTLSIISKILFGSDISVISDIDKISDYITTIIEYINKLRLPFLRFIEILPLPLTIKYKHALSGLDNIIYDKINQRRKTIESRFSNKDNPIFIEKTNEMKLNQKYTDMLSILIESTNDHDEEEEEEEKIIDKKGTSQKNYKSAKMTNQQLRDEVMTIFLAGHETTANALTWTLYLLDRHPNVESKIMDEIISITENKSIDYKISIEDVSKLKYTEMVLMESMRLYPPSWAIGRQTIKDYVLDDNYVIPSGSVIIMSQYLIHHDSRYFSRPEQFYPERWSSEFRASIPRFSYFPFGGGPRSCIGEPLAWIEGIIILATIIKKWKVTLEEDERNIKLQPIVTLRPKYGIQMKIHKRK
jgi:cytochrome P450